MSDIFISYKREDQSIARKLADAFEADRWSVWWDPNFRAGERYNDVIEKALRDARCVVVIWSKLSAKSMYVKDEATYALNRGKLVPVAIEEVEVPFRFEGLHTPRLSEWDGSRESQDFRRLVNDISAIVGPSGAAVAGEIEPGHKQEGERDKAEGERKAFENKGRHIEERDIGMSAELRFEAKRHREEERLIEPQIHQRGAEEKRKKAQPVLERWVNELKDKKIVAVVLILVSAITGLGAVFDVHRKFFPEPAVADRARDAVPSGPPVEFRAQTEGKPQIQVNKEVNPGTSQTEVKPLPLQQHRISGAILPCLSQFDGADYLREGAITDSKSLFVGLLQAVETGNLVCLWRLLEAGAPPNGIEVPRDGVVHSQTPLVKAAQAGKPKAIRILLDFGADPNLRALRGPREPSVGVPPIVSAASSQLASSVKMLVAKGADVNAATDNRYTALHWAASSGDLELVKFLISKNARRDITTTFENKTPLDLAKAKQRNEVVAFLSRK